jgi:hypothetical protein
MTSAPVIPAAALGTRPTCRAPPSIGSGIGAVSDQPHLTEHTVVPLHRDPCSGNRDDTPLAPGKVSIAVASESSPSNTMVRHLHQLKRILAAEAVAAPVSSPGGSHVVLLVSGLLPDTVTCRTNPSDSHEWWFWCGHEPIAAARDLDTAVAAIKQRRSAHASQ